jgi:hypothetical protein
MHMKELILKEYNPQSRSRRTGGLGPLDQDHNERNGNVRKAVTVE